MMIFLLETTSNFEGDLTFSGKPHGDQYDYHGKGKGKHQNKGHN